MILLLDNYDSFTWNLADLLARGGETVRVVRCDRISVDQALALEPRRIVLSPGPGRPQDRGIAVDLARRAAGRVPVLGVCLGHQAIAVAYGARIVRASRIVHGKTSPVHHDGRGVFAGLDEPVTVMRYHSLVIDRASVPDRLEVSAWLEDGTVMGVRHPGLGLEGVQFHPESYLSAEGPRLLQRFLEPAEVSVP